MKCFECNKNFASLWNSNVCPECIAKLLNKPDYHLALHFFPNLMHARLFEKADEKQSYTDLAKYARKKLKSVNGQILLYRGIEISAKYNYA